jgi:hypothetical protein
MTEESEIRATATVGVYAEVINQIYDSLDKRIREAVSNAYDAGASQIKIEVHLRGDGKIVISDDGNGMDKDDLVNKYINMGGGDNYNNNETIGRIGIGGLSVFALGDKISINTRKRGSNKVLNAELDLGSIKNKDKYSVPLDSIKLGSIRHERDASNEDRENFTEITITDLSTRAIDVFGDEGKTKSLIDKLETILPVKYRNDDYLFVKLPPEIKEKIQSERCAIDVIIHIPDLNYSNYQVLSRSIYNSQDGVRGCVVPIYPFTIEGGYNTSLNVYGFLFINNDKQLPKKWQGVNARVKNVTIERNTYFDYDEDVQARVRIGGQVYINNLDENHAIQSNRSGFAKENSDYRLVAEFMEGRIRECVERVRRNSNIDSLVKKIVNQIVKMRKMYESICDIQDKKDSSENFQLLDDREHELVKIRLYSIEDAIRSELRKLNYDCDITWSGVLEEINYQIIPEEDDFYTILLNDELREFVFDVSGCSVTCVIAYCCESLPLLIKKPKTLCLNLSNSLIPNENILKVEVGFVKVAAIMYLNYLRHPDNAKLLYGETYGDLSP